MKKFIVSLAILALAVPAMAGITVSAVDADLAGAGLLCNISYATNDSQLPRAFGINVSLSDGATITAINSINQLFYVTPTTFQLVGTTPDWDKNNNPDSASYAVVAGGVGTSGMTLEMGSLYADNDPVHKTAPGTTGVICSFTVSKACTVTITEDGLRGGVVMEDVSLNVPGYVTLVPGNMVTASVVTCRDMLTTAQQTLYDRYVAAGKNPALTWCNQYHCWGDGDNANQTVLAQGTFRIYTNDLNKVTSNWKKNPETGADPAADYAKDEQTVLAQGKFSVYTNDLNKVTGNWKKTQAQLTDCPTYLVP